MAQAELAVAPWADAGLVAVQPVRMLVLVALSALFHGAVFAAFPRRAREPYLTKERVASSVHALVVIVAVAAWLARNGAGHLLDPSRLRTGVAGTDDEWCALLLAFSTGYFLFDTVVMFRYKETWDVGGVLHHAVIGPSILLALVGGVSTPLQFVFLLEELSTPFLNLRALYRDRPQLYAVASVLFAASFIGVRLGWGSYVYYACVTNFLTNRAVALPTPYLYLQCIWQLTMCTISRVLNVYWAFLIVRKIVRSGVKPSGKTNTKWC